ncbi:hypothetical protein AVEN_165000-1 [Araneus ventricosus]|uniref:Uncharacterized protein n=1 Tax=Araneus ventricosus TaxID=182803 RepID=A0A4Y2VUS8_ARAVE|nr:hypothetical protein AVEN_165000-1 [Araneus ventricosus]
MSEFTSRSHHFYYNSKQSVRKESFHPGLWHKPLLDTSLKSTIVHHSYEFAKLESSERDGPNIGALDGHGGDLSKAKKMGDCVIESKNRISDFSKYEMVDLVQILRDSVSEYLDSFHYFAFYGSDFVGI